MPSGIPYIVGNETAERFSYYGMKAFLVIFMTNYLRMPENQANDWYHTFVMGVYAFPILGALVSDIFFGKYKTILSLSIVYCLGHLVLAINETQSGLAIGLTLIAIGSGGIKPCVSAHVGDQFNESNNSLLEKVFNYFYIGINLGSLLSILATPYLLDNYGPSIAFGVPGALMFIATFLFWKGRHEFVHIKPFGSSFIKILFSKEGLASIGKLSIIYVFVAFFWTLFDQTGSTWVTQASSKYMDKSISLFDWTFSIYPSQFQAVNALFILLLVPVFTFVVYPFLNKIIEMTPLRKIALGLIIASFSFVIIALAEAKITEGQTVGISYQIWAYLILTAAEVLVSITALEFSYSQAPNEMKSFIMSLYLLSVSLGNGIIIIVNKLTIDEVSIEQIEAFPTATLVSVQDASAYTLGEKFNISHKTGLQFINKKDTSALTGTFLVGNIDESKNQFTLWNIDRENIVSFGEYKITKDNKFSIFKLKGADYFYFFAAMMLTVGLLFIFVSENYKGKTYIQEDDSQE